VAIDALGTTEPSVSRAPRRFSPVTDAAGAPVPVLYAGDSLECALGETVFHDLPDDVSAPAAVFRADLFTLRAGVFTLARDLELADLTDAALAGLGVDREEVIATPPADYPVTVSWAQAAWDRTGAAGLIWNSRRNRDRLAYLLFVDPPRTADRLRAVRRRTGLVVIAPPLALYDGAGLGEVQTAATARNVTIVM
jgi:RES domain